MIVSLMWMTRGRPAELIYSLSSFIMNASDNSRVEYIVTIDPDDKESSDSLKKISKMSIVHDAQITILTAGKRYGYQELEQYQNLVTDIAFPAKLYSLQL